MSGLPTAKQILAGLPNAILIVGPDNRVVSVNPAAENLFGTSDKNLVGNLVETELKFQDSRLIAALIDPHASIAARDVVVLIRNRKMHVDLCIEPLASNQIWRCISLSSRQESEGRNDSETTIPEQFGARAPDVLGHEIKNPLSAIRGAAQLLARESGDSGRIHTGMIISEVDRIASLIDRMQSLSTTQPAKIQPLNIHVLIDSARTSLQSATEGKVKIIDNFDPSLPNVLADPDAMMQVLSNLLANAISAVSTVEEPRIEIATRFSFGGVFSTQKTEKSTKLPIEVIVRDNGAGVPEDIGGDIFSPFVTTKPDGQGLGLALVKKLIGDMNGRVKHERLSDQNLTQFTLYLPMAERG